jgi:hypothetical protein
LLRARTLRGVVGAGRGKRTAGLEAAARQLIASRIPRRPLMEMVGLLVLIEQGAEQDPFHLRARAATR